MPIFFALKFFIVIDAMTNQRLEEKIKELILPIITALGYELWGLTLHGAGRYSLMRIYIENLPDANNQRPAISLADCSKVSNEISAILDVEDLLKGSYNLEVSSPGLNRQLFTIDHFRRFVGSLVAIRLFVSKSEKERKNYKGRLKAVEDETIKIDVDNEIINIPLTNIEKANIIPENL